IELVGDQTYLLVAKLTKTRSGPLAAFDRLELWVNPSPEDRDRQPDVVAHGRSFNSVRWVGVSTGKKTEPVDFIEFDELILGEDWQDVMPGGDALPEERIAQTSPTS